MIENRDIDEENLSSAEAGSDNYFMAHFKIISVFIIKQRAAFTDTWEQIQFKIIRDITKWTNMVGYTFQKQSLLCNMVKREIIRNTAGAIP